MNKTNTKTPCIGTCSTVFGDIVCRGCQRFAHEVIHWNSYSAPEKQIVLARLDRIVSQVVSSKIEILDQGKLKNKLTQLNIAFREEMSPFCWVASLLRVTKHSDFPMAEFGIALKPAAASLSHKELYTQINEESFTLSKAYYDTHITRAFRQAEALQV